MTLERSVRPLGETPEESAAVEEEVQRLTAELRARGASLVVLFGSRARGDAVRGSDIDDRSTDG